MKISELLLEKMYTEIPREHRDELEGQNISKIREIAGKHNLTVTIGGGGLRKDKKFVGRGYSLRIKPKGSSERNRDGTFKGENPDSNDAFWHDLLQYLAPKYELSTASNAALVKGGNLSQRLTAKSKLPRGTNELMLWVHFKGTHGEPGPEYSANLVKGLKKQLEHTMANKVTYGGSYGKEQLKHVLDHARYVLDQEREHGREHPEIEKLLDASTFKDTTRKALANRHVKDIRSALKSVNPRDLEDALSDVRKSRGAGHKLPEVEDVLPSSRWDEKVQAKWNERLKKELMNALLHSSVGGIQDVRHEVKELKEKGHRFPEIENALKAKNIGTEFWKLALKTDNPTQGEVTKWILHKYKSLATETNYNRKNIMSAILRYAKDAGFHSPEVEAIAKSAKSMKDAEY